MTEELQNNRWSDKIKYIFPVTVAAALWIYILATNFENPYLNTAFIALVLVATLVSKPEASIIFFPLLLLYFGRSYLGFSNPVGLVKNQFITLYTAAFMVRNGYSTVRRWMQDKKHKFMLVLMLALMLLLTLQRDFVSVAKLFVTAFFALYFAMELEDRGPALSTLSVAFAAVLFSTYFYNFLYVRLFTLPEAAAMAGTGRYVGTRDANNFALYSNIALLLIDYTECLKNKKLYIAVMALLSVGVVLSVSVSGIITLALIWAFKYLDFSYTDQPLDAARVQKKIANLIMFVLCVVAVCLLEVALNYDSVVLRILERVSEISRDLADGDLNNATSSRTYLWRYYLDQWSVLPRSNQIIGNYKTYSDMITSMISSHNTYIDFLYTYGLVGLAFLVVFLLFNLLRPRKTKKGLIRLLLAVMAVNILTRSLDVQSIGTFAFLLL